MQPIDAVGVLAQPREVREDEVDAEVLELGEHQPAVEEQELVVLLEHHAVAADLAEAAEERDGDGRRHGGTAQPSRPRPSSTRRASSSSPSGSGPDREAARTGGLAEHPQRRLHRLRELGDLPALVGVRVEQRGVELLGAVVVALAERGDRARP